MWGKKILTYLSRTLRMKFSESEKRKCFSVIDTILLPSMMNFGIYFRSKYGLAASCPREFVDKTYVFAAYYLICLKYSMNLPVESSQNKFCRLPHCTQSALKSQLISHNRHNCWIHTNLAHAEMYRIVFSRFWVCSKLDNTPVFIAAQKSLPIRALASCVDV